MDEHLPFDRETFSGRLPLFPLPNVVLLPGGLISLHIFEPRYRQMVKDALENERLIGMAVIKPGPEGSSSELYDHACLGEITKEHELPDGRWLITLRGMRRVLILDEDSSREYRVASVDVLDDHEGTREIDIQRLRQSVAELAIRAPSSKMSDESELQRLLSLQSDFVDHSLFFDLVAGVSGLELDDRRRLLEAETLCERAHILVDCLVGLLSAKQKSGRAPRPLPSRN